MEKSEFSRIRHYLGKTQNEMAQLLCVSPKAVQSFEQGWRKVPASVERQLLIILSLGTIPIAHTIPCWEKKGCPPEWRDNCIVWEYKVRYFCWLMNGTFCQGSVQKSWDKKMEICWQCDVFKDMMPDVLDTEARSG